MIDRTASLQLITSCA